MSTEALPVGVEDVVKARTLLQDVSRITMLHEVSSLSARLGGAVYVKCENLQRTGSFKIRGAYVRLAQLSVDQRAAGVVAASAGNHAQGVALAARLVGTRASIYMPRSAPLPKVAATRSYGAEVRLAGNTVDETLVEAQDFAQRTGSVCIHPFDHPDIVAGQGVVGLEILEQCPQVNTIVVPTGGGGLLAGIAVAAAGIRPRVQVIGVQAEQAAAYPASLTAGHPVPVTMGATMADGIAVGCPGKAPFTLVAKVGAQVRTVSEESLSRALLFLLERTKMVVEPAGAAAMAAVLDEPEAFTPPVVVVLSGGNVDPLLLSRLLRHGLVAAGRYLSLRLRIPDRPGTLSRLLTELADLDVNVLEVEHRRTTETLHLGEVDVAIQGETRGPDHCDEVLTRLRATGYPAPEA